MLCCAVIQTLSISLSTQTGRWSAITVICEDKIVSFMLQKTFAGINTVCILILMFHLFDTDKVIVKVM